MDFATSLCFCRCCSSLLSGQPIKLKKKHQKETNSDSNWGIEMGGLRTNSDLQVKRLQDATCDRGIDLSLIA